MTRNKTEGLPKNRIPKDDHSFSKNRVGYFMLIIFFMLPFLLGSCEAVTGIFKAGMGFGIFLVAAVIIAIVVLFMRMNKNKN